MARQELRAISAASALALLLAACETTPGAGSAPKDPVAGVPADVQQLPVGVNQGCASPVVIEAENTAEGVARERAWLAENFPGYEVLSETPEQCGDTTVDRVVIVHDGIQHTVTFDTTSFYGRVDGDDLDDLLDG